MISALITGLAASSFNAYGQTNKTDAPSEDIGQTIPNTPLPLEGNDGNPEQLISENSTTSGSNNEDNGDEQNTSIEINPREERSSDSQPDGDCLFDPSLPKCAPDENGNCPEGFYMNENGQCFPAHDGCPDGYHGADDDETGRCIPNSEGCPSGMIFRPDMKTCGYKDDVCRTYPNLEDCKVDDDTANNLPYKSGFSHGCSDSKTSDPSKRYINQPGKGAAYHTNEFMRGYNDGFESCSRDNNPSPPSISKGVFKVIVEVTNQSPIDISGGITVSVNHDPENIFKSAYGIYFQADETVTKTFTFKSSDVPIGTEFEVNIDYGDDYNQRQFGDNSPEKRPEVVQFNIP